MVEENKALSLPSLKKERRIMLVIPIKEGESIDKALKKYKKKYEKTGVIKELRERQSFTKPSITLRQTKIKAAYKLQMQNAEK